MESKVPFYYYEMSSYTLLILFHYPSSKGHVSFTSFYIRVSKQTEVPSSPVGLSICLFVQDFRSLLPTISYTFSFKPSWTQWLPLSPSWVLGSEWLTDGDTRSLIFPTVSFVLFEKICLYSQVEHTRPNWILTTRDPKRERTEKSTMSLFHFPCIRKQMRSLLFFALFYLSWITTR